MNDPVLASAFYIFAALSIVPALAVVLVRNVIYAAVFLVVSFAGVAATFVLLGADFLGAVQLLVYAGAIAILIIFAIMMTHNPRRASLSNEQRWPALIISAALLVVLLSVLFYTIWPTSVLAPLEATTEPLGRLLLNEYALPFEVVSVLLVAAMIGAIVISRED
ncbi:MAG: NADH-quinone oxidoreductase subunit J [Dehalococcoidia bacterium]|nr:NADH-quinone oxidoreductase subunit J [Dehalococcoidia bacterium]